MPPTKIAFVTWSGLPDLSADDQSCANELARRGKVVTPAVWSDPAAAWQSFDAVVLRSSWDYHKRFAEFAQWLQRIEALKVNLWNPVSLVRINTDKRYLVNLAVHGVRTLPMELLPQGGRANLDTVMNRNGFSAAVIKPVVSATAHRTVLVREGEAPLKQRDLDQLLADTDAIVQRYAPEVASEGEWSLIFFDGKFSHSVLKMARPGDFRVQEDFGGTFEVRPAPNVVLDGAQNALSTVSGPWLYARVDGVVIDGEFVLMELEMTEPALFLRSDPEAAMRFADAIEAVV